MPVRQTRVGQKDAVADDHFNAGESGGIGQRQLDSQAASAGVRAPRRRVHVTGQTPVSPANVDSHDAGVIEFSLAQTNERDDHRLVKRLIQSNILRQNQRTEGGGDDRQPEGRRGASGPVAVDARGG
jgi:hypothetical protein